MRRLIRLVAANAAAAVNIVTDVNEPYPHPIPSASEGGNDAAFGRSADQASRAMSSSFDHDSGDLA
ncbi:MAG: hypothetical protein R2709_11845 [Marmoricola sp.]